MSAAAVETRKLSLSARCMGHTFLALMFLVGYLASAEFTAWVFFAIPISIWLRRPIKALLKFIHSNARTACLFWTSFIGFGLYYFYSLPSDVQDDIENVSFVIFALAAFFGLIRLVFYIVENAKPAQGILLKGEDGKMYRAYEVGDGGDSSCLDDMFKDSLDPNDPMSSLHGMGR